MQKSKCKICRRAGIKLFLKGEKCLSPKCIIMRRPYPPGQKAKKRKAPLSEFGKELREKQKLKNWYHLGERQFANYVKDVLGRSAKTEDASVILIRKLESRFDNVIFRLGFGVSHSLARQLVSHGHFLINNKPVNIPSYQLKKGDKISVKPASRKLKIFEDAAALLKKHKLPSWLKLDVQNLEAEVMGGPALDEVAPVAEIPAIFEYYSR